MKMFLEIHKNIPREGPGDNETTKKVYQSLENLPKEPKILDVGSGSGMQTVELSQNTEGKVYALDIQQRCINELNSKIIVEKLKDKINVVKGSMFKLEEYFNKESFDVIWAESSVFIIGFENGIKKWKPFLKEDGYLVVSHISWLKPDYPKELKEFWESEYPEIKSVEENRLIIEKLGYKLVNHFVIPKSGWWDNYYTPIQERINELKEKYKGNSKALERLNRTEKEIDMYKKYYEYYGYIFYVIQ